MNKSLVNQNIKKNYQLIDKRQFGLAEQNAHNLLKHDPNNHEIFNLIGDIHYKQNNFDKSIWYYFSSLERRFDTKALNRLGTNVFLLNNNKVAEKILTNLLAHDPQYYPGYLSLGLVYEQNKKIKEAKDCYKAVIKINPNEIKAYLNLANLCKDEKNYEEAIRYYSKIIENLDDNSDIKSDILYRRGGTYERIKNYEKADKDLIDALQITPDDAYILNYLAYSWLERDYKINEAIKMLETAYELESDDPYIIDSIGWAYYLTDDYPRAEKFLKRAVELMPDDPIVNDHYGDILWKLNRKIQARYFWTNVLKMKDTEKELIEKINIKMIEGLKSS